MGEVIIRQAAFEDIAKLKDNLRSEDAKEVLAEGNASVQACLEESFSRSGLCCTVERDEVVLAMFGLVPDSALGPGARVWFLGSEQMNTIKKTFVRESRRIINNWRTRYILWNTVPVWYHATIRWLESNGAKFSDKIVAANGTEFYFFYIGRA